MASPTSNDRNAVDFADFAADIAVRRRNAIGIEAPRNAGTRRTESKRALLNALDRLDAKW